MKLNIVASPVRLSDDCHQFIHLFPTTIDTWFSQFVSVERILSGIADTSEGIREHMTILQKMPHIPPIPADFTNHDVDAAAAEWIGQYDSISALVDNAININTSLHLSQAYRACILLTTYREYPMRCDVNILYQGLRKTLMLGLDQTKIGGHNAGSFVSRDQMVSLFLPNSVVSYKNLFMTLRIAKQASWKPPQPSIVRNDLAKQTGAFLRHASTCNKINALDVYHYVLRNPIIADRLENGLLTLWLLSSENLPFTCKDIIEMYNDLLNIQYGEFAFEDIPLPEVIIDGYTRSIDNPNPSSNAVRTTMSPRYLDDNRRTVPISANGAVDYARVNAAAKAEATAARIAQANAVRAMASRNIEAASIRNMTAAVRQENRNAREAAAVEYMAAARKEDANLMADAREAERGFLLNLPSERVAAGIAREAAAREAATRGINSKKGGTRRNIANRRNRSNKKRK
jgi:hypothetical protein